MDLERRHHLVDVARRDAGVDEPDPEVDVHRELERRVEAAGTLEGGTREEAARLGNHLAGVDLPGPVAAGRPPDGPPRSPDDRAVAVEPVGLRRRGTCRCGRCQLIVSVEPREELASCETEALHDRFGLPAVRLRDEGHPRLPQQLHRAVGRPAVDDDVLDLRMGLSGDALQTTSKALPRVEARCDDADEHQPADRRTAAAISRAVSSESSG